MTIHSINIAYGASSYGAYNKKLTQKTRQELEKLGIAFDKNITEEKARALIESRNVKSHNANKEESSNGKNELLQRAIELAKRLGIPVSGNETFADLMAKIKSVIKQRAMENKNDITALEELKILNNEFDAIQAQATGSMNFDTTNKMLMDSLEMLSRYNKTLLY